MSHHFTLSLLAIVVSTLAFTAATAYPLDGYESTGITRLVHQRWVQEGKISGKKRPSGELLPLEMVELRSRGPAGLRATGARPQAQRRHQTPAG